MSDFSELPEYTRDTYPSFGKKYNNEIGVISLTSWTARINTVAKTLFSLVQQCPNFHIVLVLAEEEFPKMTAELPENLMLFVENELIELMFVRKNYRSFKKVLFTMDKYRDVPVISADDDCIYTCNYAQELYDKWTENKDCVISYSFGAIYGGFQSTCGPLTLYPKHIFDIPSNLIDFDEYQDDLLYAILMKNKNVNKIALGKKLPLFFHDVFSPLNTGKIRNTQYYMNTLHKYKMLLIP